MQETILPVGPVTLMKECLPTEKKPLNSKNTTNFLTASKYQPLIKALKMGEYKNNFVQMVKNVHSIFDNEPPKSEDEQKIIEKLMSFSDILKDYVESDIEDENLQHRVGDEIVLEMGDVHDIEEHTVPSERDLDEDPDSEDSL